MRSPSRLISIAGLALGVAIVAGACSSAAATSNYSVAGATQAPATAMAPTSITIGSTSDASLGAYLTGQNGMTLYVLTKDSADTATCLGTCATNWPPLSASSGATVTGPGGASGPFATITRSDGIVQVTYNHMPLYYYSGDSKAGDTAGQGKNNTWFVAPLSGSLSTAPASTSTSSSGY